MISQTESQNPPFAESMGDFSFPKFSLHRLSGGTRCFLIKDTKQPLISIRILVERGAAAEEISGIASFAMQMLTNGSKKLSAMRIADKAEQLGAKLNSSAKWDYSLLSFSSLSDYVDDCLDLIEDCLFYPRFTPDEIDRHKRKTIADIQQDLSDPGYLSKLAFNSLMHIDNTYGHQLSGTIDSVSNISRKDLISWHNSFLNQAPYNIIVSGRFNKREILEKLEQRFGIINSAKRESPQTFTNNNESDIETVIINKPNVSQVSLRLGKATIGPSHPDYPAMQTTSVIFGGYFLSRINELLREKLGYTYGISSTIDSKKHSSVFLTSSSVKKESVKDSIEKILQELQKLCFFPVEQDELFRSTQYILGSFLRSVESPQQTASLLMGIINHSLPLDYYNKMYSSIKSLNTGALMDVQMKYFMPKGMVIAVCGDKEHLIEELSSFGKMYECNKNGKITPIT